MDNSPTGSQPSAIAVVTGVTGSVEQQPTVIQKKKVVPIKAKFPVDSPKKINFGPPKPPRHFDYVALSAGNSSSQQQQSTPAADRKAAAASSAQNIAREWASSEGGHGRDERVRRFRGQKTGN